MAETNIHYESIGLTESPQEQTSRRMSRVTTEDLHCASNSRSKVDDGGVVREFTQTIAMMGIHLRLEARLTNVINAVIQ